MRIRDWSSDVCSSDLIFDDFRIACAYFPRRKGVERRRIDQNERRLVEGADEILACPGVDRGFSAHGTVHLCKQSGWNLYEMAPTLQYGRSKAHKITDDTAAQGCDVVVPLNAKFMQPIDQDLKHLGRPHV